MEWLQPLIDASFFLIDFILHIDRHLTELVQNYGDWVLLILFVIVFSETGLVVTPFLPGDSLLFVTGALAASGVINVHLVVALLFIAAILGDASNYHIGKTAGLRLFKNPDSRIFRQEYLTKTHQFYEKYGGKTIIFARFAPIVRTFAPFVAGIGSMCYRQFFFYNVVGAALWVCSFTYLGYFFGNIPVVKRNLSFLIFGIVFLSILPAIIEYFRHRTKRS